MLRRSKGSIASKAWEDCTVVAMFSPGTLMFLSARPSRMRCERRIRQHVSPICSTSWLSKPRRGRKSGLHHLPVLSLPHSHQNFELRAFSLRKLGTVGVTSASGVDPAEALAEFTSSDAFDNCDVISTDISLLSYSITIIYLMNIYVFNDFSQAQSLTRRVRHGFGQTARRKRRRESAGAAPLLV